MKECIGLPQDEILARLRDLYHYDEDYYRGDKDYKRLAAMPEFNREYTLMQRTNEIMKQYDKIKIFQDAAKAKAKQAVVPKEPAKKV
jgi:hypothetical protein